MSGKRPPRSPRRPVAIDHMVPVLIDGRIAHVALADFLKAVENLAADAMLGSVVQRAVNRGKKKRPTNSGLTPGKELAHMFRSLTSRTITFEGDASATDPAARVPHQREGLWRALGRTEPLKTDEAYEVVGASYMLTAEGVKKKIRNLR